ncbi:predicted protein [Aspergillus nidulans FGSC A4]|uniref:Uncharacterized protein n=1 Tax=Emericella nidulans (strain FGSC A4 / ATCC 38163 / CBS 112.46 / NRRL 194 / M139) TaxID=227321 RepID=Q5AXL0_EMENI|nr:hypothetical protein [Aspergillus nidulans FGSC A4]EAA57612.1 predicted protein [Aspergillus nidulans FGSC A4]CBF71860.1 TPA: hypothetical protein ANIA_06970 [Aspergillus nidulans FGSC A4]|eukprot:XP_664574.1 predicted protein [Aspergillus nidulans FGSC A4]
MGLLAPSMGLLPMLLHLLNIYTDIVVIVQIMLTLHVIGIKRDNRQQVLELLQDVDGIRVLDQSYNASCADHDLQLRDWLKEWPFADLPSNLVSNPNQVWLNTTAAFMPGMLPDHAHL